MFVRKQLQVAGAFITQQCRHAVSSMRKGRGPWGALVEPSANQWLRAYGITREFFPFLGNQIESVILECQPCETISLNLRTVNRIYHVGPSRQLSPVLGLHGHENHIDNMVISPKRLIHPVLQQELWRVLGWPMAHRHNCLIYLFFGWWFSVAILIYQGVNHHFPMVFPHFSHGFPIWCSHVDHFPMVFLFFQFVYTTFWAWHIKAAWSPFPKIFVEPKGPPTSPCLREPPRERQGKLSKWQENASIKELVTVMAWVLPVMFVLNCCPIYKLYNPLHVIPVITGSKS